MFNCFGVIFSYTRTELTKRVATPHPPPRQMREQLTAGVKTTNCMCFYLHIDGSNLRSGSTFVSLGETFRRANFSERPREYESDAKIRPDRRFSGL